VLLPVVALDKVLWPLWVSSQVMQCSRWSQLCPLRQRRLVLVLMLVGRVCPQLQPL
jgi:hypothetical protein